ncbi:MAG: hypothetical protein NTV06_08145, partial [candidate division Zixibacteria bacterium]|nr:hypothetical protein [candidate division Zixibacteria bacterium]
SAYILGGCTKEIKGPARSNLPPTVEFVNIPVEGARFSADTIIYWYGTDVDGFIKYFRHAVVEDTIVAGWGGPDIYLALPDDSIPWIIDTVSLDNPASNSRIKMSADIGDPVRKFVASYVFIQAVDNKDAKSRIIYRLFSKNSHFPETAIAANELIDPYVNAKDTSGVLEGITISFSGTDPIDYPRNPPPFEFSWKLYGPYDSAGKAIIDGLYVESVYVNLFGDIYHLEDWFRFVKDIDTTIDTTVDPWVTDYDTAWDSTVVNGGNLINGPLGSWSMSFKDSLLPDSLVRLVQESNWTTATSVNLYDVYRDERPAADADTTRQGYFLFWCQARDDSKVPDRIPAFKWISVVEPKFERDVIVLDATPMGHSLRGLLNWPVFPGAPWASGDSNKYPDTVPAMVKSVYGRLINNWKPGSFDTANILPPRYIYDSTGFLIAIIDYPKWRCTQDYFQIGNLDNVEKQGIGSVSLRDILKHKIILYIKDSPSRQLMITSLEGQEILKGISAGMSAWSMVRGPFSTSPTEFIPMMLTAPEPYRNYFGVDRINWTAWIGFDIYYPGDNSFPHPFGRNGQIRIEDFIGAYSIQSFLPDIRLDSTLLETRYLWYKKPGTPGLGIYELPYRCEDGSTMVDSGGALPEVGYIEKSYGSEALYIYRSVYGNRTPTIEEKCGIRVGNVETYEGKVVACRYETSLFRTAHFSFTLLPVPEQTAQTIFNEMLDWLAVQRYITTGKMSNSAPVRADIEQ